MRHQTYKIALASRVVLYFIQFVVCHIFPSHEAHVFVWETSSPLRNAFPGTLHWDSAHFFAVAEQGYVRDQQFAFFPLFPLILRVVAEILGVVLGISLSSRLILANVLVNTLVFCECACLLRQLAAKLHVTNEKKQLLLMLLFCFNPASVFFSMAYTECLYLFFVLKVLLSWDSSVLGLGWLFLSGCTRSNGVVNAIFWVFPAAQALLFGTKKNKVPLLPLLVKAAAAVVVGLTPFLGFQLFAYVSMCNEQHTTPTLEWCNWPLPLVYPYVQKRYWQVGFLTEYQLKNIPKFFLAAPVFCTAAAALKKWGGEEKGGEGKGRGFSLKSVLTLQESVHFYHLLFLLVFASFFMHIEVMTRFLLSSSPLLYVFCLEQFPTSLPSHADARIALHSLWQNSSRSGKLCLCWFGGYFLLGTVLHGLSLPWC